MLITKCLFSIFIIFITTIPLSRIFIFGIPIYYTDIVLFLSIIAALIATKNLYFIKLNESRVTIAIIFLLITTTAINSILYDTNFTLTSYENLRRCLSMMPFFIVLMLSISNPHWYYYVRKLLLAGLVLHSCFIILTIILQLFDPSILYIIDKIVYKDLANIDNASRVMLWETGWYIPRGFGGYWNPNTAVAGLVMLMPFLLTSNSNFLRIAIGSLGAIAVLSTGARQGVLAIIFITMAMIARYKKYFTIPIFIIIFISLFIAINLTNALDMPDAFTRGVNIFEGGEFKEDLYSRTGLYSKYINEFLLDKPVGVIIGRGVNFVNVSAHESGIENTDIIGFVSNSWLLLLSQQGLISAVLFVCLIVSCFQHCDDTVIKFSLLGTAFIAMLDNHIAVMHFLQAILWTVLGLASSYKFVKYHNIDINMPAHKMTLLNKISTVASDWI